VKKFLFVTLSDKKLIESLKLDVCLISHIFNVPLSVPKAKSESEEG
jgi:hypothetical protein